MLKASIVAALALLTNIDGGGGNERPGGGDYCPADFYVPAIVCEEDHSCGEAFLLTYTGECWWTGTAVRDTASAKLV